MLASGWAQPNIFLCPIRDKHVNEMWNWFFESSIPRALWSVLENCRRHFSRPDRLPLGPAYGDDVRIVFTDSKTRTTLYSISKNTTRKCCFNSAPHSCGLILHTTELKHIKTSTELKLSYMLG